jgi:hypothetical protein
MYMHLYPQKPISLLDILIMFLQIEFAHLFRLLNVVIIRYLHVK